MVFVLPKKPSNSNGKSGGGGSNSGSSSSSNNNQQSRAPSSGSIPAGTERIGNVTYEKYLDTSTGQTFLGGVISRTTPVSGGGGGGVSSGSQAPQGFSSIEQGSSSIGIPAGKSGDSSKNIIPDTKKGDEIISKIANQSTSKQLAESFKDVSPIDTRQSSMFQPIPNSISAGTRTGRFEQDNLAGQGFISGAFQSGKLLISGLAKGKLDKEEIFSPFKSGFSQRGESSRFDTLNFDATFPNRGTIIDEALTPASLKSTEGLTKQEFLERRDIDFGIDFNLAGLPRKVQASRISEKESKKQSEKAQKEVDKRINEAFSLYQGEVDKGNLSVDQAQFKLEGVSQMIVKQEQNKANIELEKALTPKLEKISFTEKTAQRGGLGEVDLGTTKQVKQFDTSKQVARIGTALGISASGPGGPVFADLFLSMSSSTPQEGLLFAGLGLPFSASKSLGVGKGPITDIFGSKIGSAPSNLFEKQFLKEQLKDFSSQRLKLTQVGQITESKTIEGALRTNFAGTKLTGTGKQSFGLQLETIQSDIGLAITGFSRANVRTNLKSIFGESIKLNEKFDIGTLGSLNIARGRTALESSGVFGKGFLQPVGSRGQLGLKQFPISGISTETIGGDILGFGGKGGKLRFKPSLTAKEAKLSEQGIDIKLGTAFNFNRLKFTGEQIKGLSISPSETLQIRKIRFKEGRSSNKAFRIVDNILEKIPARKDINTPTGINQNLITRIDPNTLKSFQSNTAIQALAPSLSGPLELTGPKISSKTIKTPVLSVLDFSKQQDFNLVKTSSRINPLSISSVGQITESKTKSLNRALLGSVSQSIPKTKPSSKTQPVTRPITSIKTNLKSELKPLVGRVRTPTPIIDPNIQIGPPRTPFKFGFDFALPDIGLVEKRSKPPKATRKLTRTPSLVSAAFGITAPKPLKFERTGLIARPLIVNKRRKR